MYLALNYLFISEPLFIIVITFTRTINGVQRVQIKAITKRALLHPWQTRMLDPRQPWLLSNPLYGSRQGREPEIERLPRPPWSLTGYASLQQRHWTIWFWSWPRHCSKDQSQRGRHQKDLHGVPKKDQYQCRRRPKDASCSVLRWGRHDEG